MAGNSFGRLFRLTTFGESHGAAIGGIVDGCPAGIPISETAIQAELDKRKPGCGDASTQRKESDRVQLLSGTFNELSTGTPIGFIIRNEDHRSSDYGNIAEVFRPGHADWTYFSKYNHIRDYRGGGRASGRETACRVVGGSIAREVLRKFCGAEILAGCVELGSIAVPEAEINLEQAQATPFFAASQAVVPLWENAIAKARADGDTLGGIVRIIAKHIPAGLGEPVFDKLDADLAKALMSVGAVKGIEIGSGFRAPRMKGSLNNDTMLPGGFDEKNDEPIPIFGSNFAGGILGGISTGQEIILQAAVKPIASISREQETIDKHGNAVKIRIGGRHDLSALPRIVPVLAAMTALALADALLLHLGRAGRI